MSQSTSMSEFWRRQDDFDMLKKYVRANVSDVKRLEADARHLDGQVICLRRQVDHLKHNCQLADCLHSTGHGLYIPKDRKYTRNSQSRYMY